MFVFLTWGLAGIIRGEIGSWTGGLVVGFLGGLALGLEPKELILFTALCALVFSFGWGRYIEAIQTGTRPIWGWAHLLKLSLLYIGAGLALPGIKFFHLGWILLVWPITLGVDEFAKRCPKLQGWDSWKIAEFCMTGILGVIFSLSMVAKRPIVEFPLIVYTLGMMGLYKHRTTEVKSINTEMLFVTIPIIVHMCLYLG